MSASCGNPSVENDALMPRRRKFDRAKTCMKCKINTGNVVIRHAVYCKKCFFSMLNIKFKRSLEPTINPVSEGPSKKALHPSGYLIIAFSGGLGSTVLLDLIHQRYVSSRRPRSDSSPPAGKDPKNEMVWNEIRVCYVEVCGAYPGMRDRTEDVRRVIERYDGFELVSLRVEDAFDVTWWESVGCKPPAVQLGMNMADESLILSSLSKQTSPLSALRHYLSSLPASTAVPTTIQNLIRLILLHKSRATNSSHLVLGTCLTSLSISLVSLVAQGGGFNVKEEVQEEWSPDDVSADANPTNGSVRIVRPLKDIVMKECAMYAWWNSLKIIGQEAWPGARHGIGGITKDFIIRLEKDYPSTVSTITRTCAKLAPREDAAGVCILCNRPAQSQVENWKNRISIRSLSDASNDEPRYTKQMASLAPYLCYACFTTLTSKSSKTQQKYSPSEVQIPPDHDDDNVALPQWVQARLSVGDGQLVDRRGMRRDEMKDAIQDYLLDE